MTGHDGRTRALAAARHAILALRQVHNVPDGATAHGVEITVGCVTDDLGQMADAIRAHFLAERDDAAHGIVRVDVNDPATVEKVAESLYRIAHRDCRPGCSLMQPPSHNRRTVHAEDARAVLAALGGER